MLSQVASDESLWLSHNMEQQLYYWLPSEPSYFPVNTCCIGKDPCTKDQTMHWSEFNEWLCILCWRIHCMIMTQLLYNVAVHVKINIHFHILISLCSQFAWSRLSYLRKVKASWQLTGFMDWLSSLFVSLLTSPSALHISALHTATARPNQWYVEMAMLWIPHHFG